MAMGRRNLSLAGRRVRGSSACPSPKREGFDLKSSTARLTVWREAWADPYLALAACAAPACLSPRRRKTSYTKLLPTARPAV
jgi:hypothetical protein